MGYVILLFILYVVDMKTHVHILCYSMAELRFRCKPGPVYPDTRHSEGCQNQFADRSAQGRYGFEAIAILC